MLIYSNFYDFLAKVVLVAILAAILIAINPSYWIEGMASLWSLKHSQAEFLFFISFCVVIVFPLLVWVYVPLLSPISAWCYLRFSLKTPVSWEVARQVESLFRPTMKRLEWYPLKELKTLPPEERLSELLRFFQHLQTQ